MSSPELSRRQLLEGAGLLVVGFAITDTPGKSVVAMTALLAAFFIIAGLFRIAASLVVRFPHWGWALLNGVVTLPVKVELLIGD